MNYCYFMDAEKKYQILLRRADEMRSKMTKAESKLYFSLSDPTNALPPFHAQHVIYPYIVDFVCLENRLIIEVDGVTHNFSRDSDSLRDNDLVKLGFKILRFTNGEVIAGIDVVIQAIQFECRYRPTVTHESPIPLKKKTLKRKMVVPLPRVVYEVPAIDFSRTKASKVRIRKALDGSKGEVPRIYCALCSQPIANADARVRHRKVKSDDVFWAHKSCASN